MHNLIMRPTTAHLAVWLLTFGVMATTLSVARPQNQQVVGATPLSLYGVIGDGKTDDSLAIQRAIDANRGGTIIIPVGVTVLAASVTMKGRSYDGTKIDVQGSFKLLPDSGRATDSGAWIGLLLRDVDNITISGNFDGNRGAMTDREHVFMIALSGARHVKLPALLVSEIRGDGVYVSSMDFGHESAPSQDIDIGHLKVINSSDDGRNAISIVSGVRISISLLESEHIGAVVQQRRQPGGFDIEPNFAWQTAANINIERMTVTSAGTSAIGIIGRARSTPGARDWNVHDVRITSFHLVRTGPSINGMVLMRCADITATGSIEFSGVTGTALVGDWFDNVNLAITSNASGRVARVANLGAVMNSALTYTPIQRCSNYLPTDRPPGLRIVGPCIGDP